MPNHKRQNFNNILKGYKEKITFPWLTMDKTLAFSLEIAATTEIDSSNGEIFNFKVAWTRWRTPPFPQSSYIDKQQQKLSKQNKKMVILNIQRKVNIPKAVASAN